MSATAPTHDIFVRLTVLKTVSGRMTPEKKHKAVRTARHAFDRTPGYTVVSAEISGVREVGPHG
jgi:hypothetical protein